MTIRTKNRDDLKRERRPNGKGRRCNDWVICAMPWPLHGVNAGTLLRTCEAVGACLYIPHYPWVPQALSKGYTLSQRADVHWIRPNALGWLKAQHEREDTAVIAAEQADEAVRLADLKPASQRTVMVLGSESSGIPDDALEYLDGAVEIPMIGTGTSLNVTVAASLVLYRLVNLI